MISAEVENRRDVPSGLPLSSTPAISAGNCPGISWRFIWSETMKRSSTASAASRYFSASSGESELSNPAPMLSGAKSAPALTAANPDTPKRSLMVLVYSLRAKRRMTVIPGSGVWRRRNPFSHTISAWRSLSLGCSLDFSGGISPEAISDPTFCHKAEWLST